MRKDADDYYLWYYPGTEEIEQLTHFGDDEWEGTPMVSYRASELGTKEADASFAELYSVLKERIYGMNDVLDDIISEDDN